MAIDHTKIRVLYLEGATERYIEQAVQSILGRGTVRGAYSPLQEALMEDRDIDCTAVAAAGSGGDFTFPMRTDNGAPGLPEIASELFAYDAIILSNVPAEALDARYQAWIEEWVGRRGGGLLMAGGPYSFASGRWNGTTIAKLLPVELSPGAGDWGESPTAVDPRHRRDRPPDLADHVRRGAEPRAAQDPAPVHRAATASAGRSRRPMCWPAPIRRVARASRCRRSRSSLTAGAARWS